MDRPLFSTLIFTLLLLIAASRAEADDAVYRVTGVKVDATDGARVMTGDGWWLLRASNTQDVLVARAEAKDEAGLARLVADIDQQLALSGAARPAGH